MSTGKHYFIERNADGKYTVTSADGERASAVFANQIEAVKFVKWLNPDDKPDVERARTSLTGKKWRRAGA